MTKETNTNDKDYKKVIDILMNTNLATINEKIEKLEELKIKNLYNSVSIAALNASVGMFTQSIDKYMKDKMDTGERISNKTLNSFLDDAFDFSILLSANILGAQKEIKLFLFIVSCIMMMSLVGFVKPEFMIKYFTEVCKENEISIQDILKGLVMFIEILELKNPTFSASSFLH